MQLLRRELLGVQTRTLNEFEMHERMPAQKTVLDLSKQVSSAICLLPCYTRCRFLLSHDRPAVCHQCYELTEEWYGHHRGNYSAVYEVSDSTHMLHGSRCLQFLMEAADQSEQTGYTWGQVVIKMPSLSCFACAGLPTLSCPSHRSQTRLLRVACIRLGLPTAQSCLQVPTARSEDGFLMIMDLKVRKTVYSAKTKQPDEDLVHTPKPGVLTTGHVVVVGLTWR